MVLEGDGGGLADTVGSWTIYNAGGRRPVWISSVSFDFMAEDPMNFQIIRRIYAQVVQRYRARANTYSIRHPTVRLYHSSFIIIAILE